jgi:hypothetical protein
MEIELGADEKDWISFSDNFIKSIVETQRKMRFGGGTDSVV